MRVRHPAVLAWGALLLWLGCGVDDDAWRGGHVQTNVQQRVAHIIWIGGNGDFVPVADELRVHGVLERRIVVPDRLGYAVLGLLQQDELLLLQGPDFFRYVGPAILQVFDRNALCGLLALEIGLELLGIADVELGLVVVQVRCVVVAYAVLLGSRMKQLTQLLPVGLLLPDIQVLHDGLEGLMLQALLQVVAGKAKLRVDVVASARVCWLRVDDIGTLCRTLALGAVGRRGRRRRRRRSDVEERHSGVDAEVSESVRVQRLAKGSHSGEGQGRGADNGGAAVV